MAIQLDLGNRDQLLASCADWLNRADLTAQLSTFLWLAEAQFNRELRVREMLTRAYTVSDQETVTLPLDFLEHYSLVVDPAEGGSYPPLRYMSEKESNDIKAGLKGAARAPFGYTLVGDSFELVPAPPGNLKLKLVYYARIPSLLPEQPINWLLLKSPDLYLYSTLLQSAPYLNDTARLQTWALLRKSLMDSLQMESEAAQRPRSQLTARPVSF